MSTPLIARSFLEASGRLTSAERLQCFDFISRFTLDPSHPSLSLERMVEARSPHVWSGRVSKDLRTVLHKDGPDWSLLFVGHHDEAYNWARRRDVQRHPATGVLQVVETIETVREVVKTIVRREERPAPRPASAPAPLANTSREYLLSLGVPPDWIADLQAAPTEDDVLELASRLPQEVGERLLALASGERVEPPLPIPPTAPLADSADARRSFIAVGGEDELRAALEAPWAQWIHFLHPSQRSLATGTHQGPVLVTGSAGTGKTVVALHRARHLARQGKRVLLTTYVNTLCQNLEAALKLFCTPAERERITISTVHKTALHLVKQADRTARPAQNQDVTPLLDRLAAARAPEFPLAFVHSEWEAVIRTQGIATWDDYAAARRTGRGTPLSQKDRRRLWGVFGELLNTLAGRGLYDWPFLCLKAAQLLKDGPVHSAWDAVIVDELQDLKPPEIRLLAALVPEGPDTFMLVGDAGQRIYPGGFSLKALGIDVRGRARILRVNYRTTEQIRRFSDRLLEKELPDEDQALPSRRGTLSLVGGPQPRMQGFQDPEEESRFLVEEIKSALARGLPPEGLGLFVRKNRQAEVLQQQLGSAGISAGLLSDEKSSQPGLVRVGTMHRAKGLEFQVVFLAGVAEGHLPDPQRLAECVDAAEREDFLARERHLLYVALTRAREEVTITWTGRPSSFLQLLGAQDVIPR